MAKKTSNTKLAVAGDVEKAGTLLMVPIANIRIVPEIAAREGDPDPDKIQEFAENFIERMESGREAQISPLICRSSDGEWFDLIDGRHRLDAGKLVEKATKQPFTLLVRVVAANDEQGLIDAIQSNAFREEPNDFDRAGQIEKLIAIGKTQVQCATIMGLHESSISQIRKVGKLPAKYRKAIENGDIERDAAILIASLDGDDKMRDEVLEESMRHKRRVVDIETSIANKRAKEDAQSKITEAREAEKKAKEVITAKTEERKIIEKEVKDLETAASKTKDVDELIPLREKQKELKATADKLAADAAAALKDKEKATKLVEKAKADAEKVKEQAATKKTVTQEDVKDAAQKKGATVKGKEVTGGPRSAKVLDVELEAMVQDEKNVMPDSAIELIAKLQSFLKGSVGAVALRKAFVANCLSDEQYNAAIKAKARK